MEIITLEITRDSLELIWDALNESVDPDGDCDYIEALNVIEAALGKELTPFDENDNDDEDQSGDLDG